LRENMNRVDEKFKQLKQKNKKAFIVYICAGDPNMPTTKEIAIGLDIAGVDIIELGIPFSDPLADGPTIQKASQRALSKGANIDKILRLVKSLRKKIDTPIVLMGYYNPIFHYGILNFIKHSKQAGVDGVIIPDLIPEEADEFIFIARQHSLSTVFLASPTSTIKRLKLISSKSTGFIYYVSVAGVTGTRRNLDAGIRKNIQRIKKISSKPVCVGFGVSTPGQVKTISAFSDGVIVGSAIIKIIEKNLNSKITMVREIISFIGKLKGRRK
jgi:tryptophan synthase alpha chain